MSRHMQCDPKQEFANRLARIREGGITTNRTLFVGMEEMLEIPPGTFVRKRKKRGWALPMVVLLLVGSMALAGATMT